MELRPQEQPAAAGMQARTPTCLLDPCITLLIAPPPCPSVTNSPGLRDPRPPRAFPVPMRHPEAGTTLRTPLPGAQMGDLNAVFSAMWAAQISIPAAWGGAHGLDYRLLPHGQWKFARRPRSAAVFHHTLTGCKLPVAHVYCSVLVDAGRWLRCLSSPL